jgi:hypothetical protein
MLNRAREIFTTRTMHKRTILILLHLTVVLLACTNFSLLTAPLGRAHFSWEFALTYRNGWGYAYQSDYSLAQVVAYLVAYASGVALYPRVTRPKTLATFAALICLLGAFSFVIELSHWFLDHHLCLIASFPILLVATDLWTIASAFSRETRAHAAV